MTIGRFSSKSNLRINGRNPKTKSALNINESAYYLIDDIELYPAPDSGCSCTDTDPPPPPLDFTTVTLGDTVILNNIHFNFDSYDLNPTSFEELSKLAQYLNDSTEINAIISGHTDQVGSDTYNLDLSKKRADEVSNWLINTGINPGRIVTKGFGNQYPLDVNTPELNRRVEIRFIIK